MPQNPLEIWNRVVPETTAIALKDVAFGATAEAYALCKDEYPNYPIKYIAGQNRFTKLQYKMLEFGNADPVFQSEVLLHLNGFPFVRLSTPELRITSATIESERAYPQMSLFRDDEQAQQLQFLNQNGVLVCHLCVCVDGDLSVPKFVQIHFPDGKDAYLDQYVDLTKLTHRVPILPVESVRDDNRPRERARETETDRDKA